MRAVHIGMTLITALSAWGCRGVPKGLAPVAGFEVDRYLGKWYELSRLDHRFERGLTDVSVTSCKGRERTP